MRLMFNWGTGLLPDATAAQTMIPWEDDVAISKGDQRSHTVSGLLRGYQANWSFPASWNTYPPNEAPVLWRDLGYIGATTFKTNAPLSDHPTWSTGSITAGTIVYDKYARRDYYCNQTLTSLQNSLSPSQCVASPVDAVRGYWRDMGVANAFRMFDGETYSRTKRIASSMYCEFGFNQDNTARPRGIFIFGMDHIKSVRLRVYSGATLLEEQTKSTLYAPFPAPPAVSESRLNQTAITFITATSLTKYNTFRLDFTKVDTYYTSVEVGMIAVGEAFELGPTNTEAKVRYLNFSRQERDPTFGDIKFIRRGVAKILSASVHIQHEYADTIIRGINAYRGGAIAWDFNNDTDYDHLRVWGFCRDTEFPYTGLKDAEIPFEVEGLVEEG